MTKVRSVGAIVIVMTLLAGLMLLATPALARADVCADLDSGKIDTVGDPASVTITASPGYLISEYCVKAGSANQGDGPVYVSVDPPQETVTITHPSGKDISHYSWKQIQPTTTTSLPTSTTDTTAPPSTTTTVPDTTTTVPPTTSTSIGTTTTTDGTVTTTLPSTTVPPTSPELPFTGIDSTGMLSGLCLGLLISGVLLLIYGARYRA